MAELKDLDFKLTINNKGTIEEVTNNDVIKQSIKTILSTIPGERVRLPEFGSNLINTLFEPIDQFTTDEVETSIEEALENFENRITIRSIRAIPNYSDNYYDITIDYFIRSTGVRDTFNAKMRVLDEE